MKQRECGRGQIMPILALALAAVVGVAALGIDVFYLYWNKNRLQAATDAAALAGATYLGDITLTGNNSSCTYANSAQNAACTYALSNGVLLSEIQNIIVDTSNNTVTVRAERTVPKQGINYRLSSPAVDPNGTWSQHSPTDPRAVVVPLVDWSSCLVGGGGANCSPVVKGFAEVWITGTDGSTINAIFIRRVAPGTAGAPGGADTGADHAVLLR